MKTEVTAHTKALELKKHVAIIHCHNQFSLLERKSGTVLLQNAYHELLTKEKHRIYIPDLCKQIGYSSNDHNKIKETLMSLASKVIEWNILDEERGGREIWNMSTLIASASIDGAYCEYSYSPVMRELLFRPEHYGKLDLNILSKFKSSYGVALYENCMRYQDIPQTPRFELPLFRKLMGVGDVQYPLFRDFRKRVIEPAVTEVNKYSNISVSYKLVYAARRAVAIQFYMKKNHSVSINEPQQNKRPLYDALVDWGCSDKMANEIIDFYKPEYIFEKIKIIQLSASYKSGKISNLARYLYKALEDDYRLPKSSLKSVKHEVDEMQSKKNMAIASEKYQKYYNKAVIERFAELHEKDKEEVLSLFKDYIKSGVHYDIYMKGGLEDPLVEEKFCDFIKYKKLFFIKDIKTLERFLEEDFLEQIGG